jgi:signal transduction histidine kinase
MMARLREAEGDQEHRAGRPDAREGRAAPPPALRRAVGAFRRLPGTEVVWLAVRESRGTSAVIQCATGLQNGAGLGVVIHAGRGLGGRILEGGEPSTATVADAGMLSNEERAFLDAEHVTNVMVIPLVNAGVQPGELRVDGAVYAGRRDAGRFEPDLLAAAGQVAGHVAFDVRFAQRLREATQRWDRLLGASAEPDAAAAGRLERLAREIAADARAILRTGIAMVYRVDRGLGVLHSLAIAGEQGVPADMLQFLRRGQVIPPGYGATGGAVARRRPCVVRDYGSQAARMPPSMIDAAARIGRFTTLAVPLVVGEDVIGTITLARYVMMRGFERHEARAAMRLAHEAAPRVARAVGAAEHNHRRQGGVALSRLAGSLTQSRDEAAVCEHLAASVLGLVQGREVMVWDADRQPLVAPLPQTRVLARAGERRLERLREEVRRTRRAVWTPDLYNDHRLADPVEPDAAEEIDGRAVLVAPIKIQETLLAWVAVTGDTGHTFTPAEQELVQALADQAALGIANARACGELERTRAARIKQEKLLAMGRLAAWVAHELRNPLQNLVALMGELRERPPEGGWQGAHVEEHQEILGRARAEAGRAAGIVDRMLGALRERAPVLEPTEMGQLVEEAIALVGDRAAAQGVELRLAPPSAPLRLLGDPVMLRQVAYNILTNALDALSGPGQVEVRLREERDEGGSGRMVVRVQDTGRGIAPDDLPHVFDLFFTNKPLGEGVGLGLAMCQTVVEQHGGEITVESPGLGRGTSVEFWVPATPRASRTDRP